MRLSRFLSLGVAVSLTASAVGQQADAPPVTPNSTAAAHAVEQVTAPAAGTSRLAQLNDFHFAAWVLIESDTIDKVSQWAETHATQESVREFAQENGAAHDAFATSLRGPLTAGKAQDNEKFDFAVILRDVSNRLARNANDPATTAPTVTGAPPLTTPPERTSASTERRNSEADTSRENRRVIGNLRDRRERDGRLREAVQTFRDNLPGLVDELSASMDQMQQREEEVGLAFVDFKRQLGERYAASLIEELERGPQQDIAPGYLGIMTAAHLQLIDTMTVARQHASPELQKTLDEQISAARERLQKARELMVSSVAQPSGPPRP